MLQRYKRRLGSSISLRNEMIKPSSTSTGHVRTGVPTASRGNGQSKDLQGRRASSASARSASGASKSIAVSTSRAQEAGLERAMNNLSVKASSKPNAGLSLELKPLKIGVHGVFVNNEPYRTGTPLQTSHMVQLPVVGVGFRLATSTTFVLPRSREIATILDSGAPFFLVRKDTFDSQDELAASAIRDEHNNLRYYEPHFGSDPRRLRGFLAHGHVKIGPPRGGFLEITDQRFYACDNHPLFSGTFQALIGTAPEPFVPQVGELESDCPTIVKTVAEQNGLRVIQGTYLRPWNEDPSSTYTLTGNIDIGSVDSHLCSGQVIEWTKRSSELPYHLGVKTAVNYGNSSTGYQRLVHWNGERYEATEHVLAMLDTGVPTIAFNKAMFAAWKDTLRYTSLPYVETEASMGTFLQIPISHILLLRNLQFTFLSAEQGEFSVKIPSSRLILPSRIYRALGINAYEGYAVMSTIGITSSHHVTLGIPFYQERYIISNCSQPDQHYVGFVKTPTTNQIGPEFQKLVESVKQEQAKKEEESKRHGHRDEGKVGGKHRGKREESGRKKRR